MPPKVPYTWRQPDYPGDGSEHRWIEPTMIIFCQDADIEQSVEPLMRTLHEPIGIGPVASVFVHETMRERLIERVRNAMSVVHRKVKTHAHYKQALRRVDCLQAELVSMQQPDDIGFRFSMVEGSPLVVCDFPQSFFSSQHPSTVVTLHTFRNLQELSELTALEKLPFVSAAIWSPKMAAAYEIAMKLKLPVIYINCAAISLAPVLAQYEAKQTVALIENNFHYEVLLLDNEIPKIIVYPALLLLPAPPTPPKTSTVSLKKTATEQQE
ncbi:CG13539 [Drosophila busckii]|uniref:CG13539 n=1 Tax=Drosophila busckii TaxID=30019 RepID=A0A0M4F9W0_DROBS|nr:uncharacterized protein LOC108606855 [Drosophila busckii]ALC49412.1 CG13539 [Drosophila busckii]